MSTTRVRVATSLIFLCCLLSGPAQAESPDNKLPGMVEPASLDLSAMTRLNEMTTLGVRATAYISGLQPVSAGAGSHRVAVVIANEKTGIPVQKALVGIKHRRLFGKASEPVWMQASAEQPGTFVADVLLKERGTYLFIVGSKLEDDKKRQFTFQYLYR